MLLWKELTGWVVEALGKLVARYAGRLPLFVATVPIVTATCQAITATIAATRPRSLDVFGA